MPFFHKAFQYEILTPAGLVHSGQAVHAVLPSQDGQVGVLGGRAPLAVVIDGGLLILDREDGLREEFFVHQGFAQTREDRLTVVVEECTAVGDIDAEAAFAQIEQLRQRRPGEELDPTRRAELLRLARLRFNIAQRARKEHAQVRLDEQGASDD